MASHAEMAASNMLRLPGFPSNMGKQRSSFISTRHPPSRRSRVVRHCLNLRHLCRLPNQRAIVPNIRPMPALTAAVSSGVNSPLIEASGDDMGLVSRIIHFYRKPFLQESEAKELLRKVQAKVSSNIIDIKTEQCFNVELEDALGSTKLATLQWLLAETYEPDNLQTGSFLEEEVSRSPYCFLVEVGPRMTFSTAFSTNAVSICKALSLMEVTRLERSRRYLLCLQPGSDPLDESQLNSFAALIHDRMTECVYPSKLTSFRSDVVPEPVSVIPVMEKGREALEEINLKMGLAFDEQDIKYYTHLFRDDIKRNPTTVELFDIAQSNSEHSRHWFFNGKLEIDGETMPSTLFQLVKSPLKANPNNSIIGFKDNSSAIKGTLVNHLRPALPGSTSPLSLMMRELGILFTAETHNFPCAVAPYPGAETGAGGRIRDTHATGKGSFVVASTAGYCVGNLQIEESYAPWEDSSFSYPSNLASPLQILIDASDGASDYGNKFGEPLIQGFTRNFGSRLPNGERREWLKPIMFSGAIGQIDHAHISKGDPEIGMLVVKIGGPAYRIGMGGGAASSMVSGQNDAELDFNAVQRGDAEMAQKLYRVIRACVEMGEKNPIISIHDQGAGGNCNVVKEIIYPKGAEIDIRSIVVGDHTLSVLEIWGAEYQEQDALLVKPESRNLLQSLCDRERVSMAVLGEIDGSGKIVLIDSAAVEHAMLSGLPPPPPAVDLELEKVLGDMPQKTFDFKRVPRSSEPLDIAPEITLMDVLKRVLKLPSVCSKRFLTTKVDRCVTGLVAQQQTVGPLQLPLADVAVVAQTYTDLTGGACAIGEQPIKGLLNPEAMARLAVGEALTNLVWAKVTSLADVKASGNWMYAAKIDGEGADMYDAAVAMADCMIQLGIAIDGGKDSLSMAAQCDGELVKAPGNLVISAYVTCPDITLTVTPDLKLVKDGVLLHVDLAKGKRRLGCSALAQAFDQIGNDCPDIEDVPYLKKVFEVVQELLSERLISAGHDISDGGLIVTILEMAFAGNCGVNLNIELKDNDLLQTLFAEELGLVIEVHLDDLDVVKQKLHAAGVSANVIGEVTAAPEIELLVDGEVCLKERTSDLRDLWEETSFQLEELQRLKSCVKLEKEGLKSRTSPSWHLSFTPKFTDKKLLSASSKPKVAIIREEGSNSDREMSAAFHAAGFEPWDITMSDLLNQKASLTEFRGIAFVGGFSYADVLDSAKGWAASIRFNQPLIQQFQEFYNRPDTFSLGVCNGCQLMALLGWVPGPEIGGSLGAGGDMSQPRFTHNESGRFECRFISVAIGDSPSIMFRGMEGSTLGIWSAHGEGRAFFPDENVLSDVVNSNLAPLRYCDDANNVTEVYPFNPNGSPLGIAALCSPNGRHLALMPHPERSFMMWQYPWYPKEWQVEKGGPSPWLRMFQNAREWCS
ncbi:probable phosphoribosylformylglycinamidine synthase, chloroplastic/mitochondrial [Triticum aestivum]|uniref:probable phosphoribosylformylglycinamidine synthase, chloroplastic/mitochondrial n=1 Tax=Triticum aestivum TaxID=4565 RepID=UPI001D0149F6|nr:probable phosphoribosylformylglycinamidine synthase, chloroplastic/mitochondrial [Triticum aestivum]